MNTHARAHTHTYIHTQTHTYTHTHLYIYIYIYMCLYTHVGRVFFTIAIVTFLSPLHHNTL